MTTRLYVSPHLDDAALSCAAGIVAAVAAGDRVVVCTVFSRGDPRRCDEDAAALRAVGAEPVHLDFEDAPWRLGCPRTFRALMLDPAVDDATVDAVVTAVAELVAAEGPQQVWWPLGIGGHIDHRTVFEASRRVECPTVYYEDRPYAFVPALGELRRLELVGGRSPTSWSADLVGAQVDAAGVAGFFTDDERPSCIEQLVDRLGRAHAGRGVRIEANDRIYRPWPTAAVALIDAYASQTEFFGWRPSVAPWWRRGAGEPVGGWVERAVILREVADGLLSP